jgi:muramidase (phage lysozyme)
MPQNWWEFFPEIQPSPTARPLPLPGPGGAMIGAPIRQAGQDQHNAYGPLRSAPKLDANASMSKGRLDVMQDRRTAYELARQRGGDPESIFRQMRGLPSPDRSRETGRPVVGAANQPPRPNNPPAPTLTPWQIRRRNENTALLANPRIRAFLDMISFSEGDTNYGSLFGNHHQTFTDRSTHPGNRGELYRGKQGGAAGRYQIMPDTYRDLNRLLGPYTMSDRDQDLMAVELIREGPALESVVSGHLDEAVSRLGRRRAWTSFPVLENGRWQQNPSHQPTRNIEDLRAHFQDALNRYGQHGPGLVGTAANLGR